MHGQQNIKKRYIFFNFMTCCLSTCLERASSSSAITLLIACKRDHSFLL